MLSHDMREKISGEICIKDASPDAVENTLGCMRRGKCRLDCKNLLPLMSLARRQRNKCFE